MKTEITPQTPFAIALIVESFSSDRIQSDNFYLTLTNFTVMNKVHFHLSFQ
jgi:hypothetical protein